MLHYRMYIEVIRGYAVDVQARSEDDAGTQVFAMTVEQIETKGTLANVDTGDFTNVIDVDDDEEETVCNNV